MVLFTILFAFLHFIVSGCVQFRFSAIFVNLIIYQKVWYHFYTFWFALTCRLELRTILLQERFSNISIKSYFVPNMWFIDAFCSPSKYLFLDFLIQDMLTFVCVASLDSNIESFSYIVEETELKTVYKRSAKAVSKILVYQQLFHLSQSSKLLLKLLITMFIFL